MGDEFIVQRGYPAEFAFRAGDEPPPQATLLLVTDAMRREVALALADGEWRATLTSEDTSGYPAGEGAYEVYGHGFADAARRERLGDGRLRVGQSILRDGESALALTRNERILAKAQEVLETASGSAETSFSVAGASYSFEGRNELLNFVARMERVVRQERSDAAHGVRRNGLLVAGRGRRTRAGL